MFHEDRPDSRGQKSNIRRLQVGASIGDAWQGVVVLGVVRKDGSGRIVKVLGRRTFEDESPGLLLVGERRSDGIAVSEDCMLPGLVTQSRWTLDISS